MDQLPDSQKNTLVGIFPLTPKRGYERKGGGLYDPKFVKEYEVPQKFLPRIII